MKLRIETTEIKQKVLIIDKNFSILSQRLRSEIKKYNYEIYISPLPPKDLSLFDICFFINEPFLLNIFNYQTSKKIIFIFINQQNRVEKYYQLASKNNVKNVRFVNINGDENFIKENVDSILWFSFSPSQERLLNLRQSLIKKSDSELPKIRQKKIIYPPYHLGKKINIKKVIFVILFLVFFFHLFFFPTLILSSYFFYQAGSNFKANNLKQVKDNLYCGSIFFDLSKKLYEKTRPTYLLFSLAYIPDNLFQINEKAKSIIQQSIILYENSQQIIKLIFKKNKTVQEKNFLSLRLDRIKTELVDLEENITYLNQKIPNYKQTKKIKDDLLQGIDLLVKIKKILPFFNDVFAKNTEKYYLLLFANNIELRPGGGFIGSFGVVSMKDMTLADLRIYDVYDADGQLNAHIEPPEPIKKYLHQPHWFLRDSAFSPDFIENYAQAKVFLERTLGLTNFSGGILITTSTIQNILGAFGNIYLSDFKEIINQDNFHIKAQLYAQKNFFPGSTQKRNFLTSLANQLIIKLESGSPKKIIQALKKSFDEKQMIVYFDQPELEKIFDDFFWSGRVIEPNCPIELKNCLSDYIFPVDANMGTNKANFFISRFIETNINIDSQGIIKTSLIIKFKNQSQNLSESNGIYKNYFQVFLNKDSIIKTITKNDVLIDDYDQEINQFNKIGFYFEVLPQSTSQIKIDYQSTAKLIKGKVIYQVIIQKQIGSSNNDLLLRINLPKNIYLINQNYSPLVKNNQIIYNSNLSADKIFFTELIKE